MSEPSEPGPGHRRPSATTWIGIAAGIAVGLMGRAGFLGDAGPAFYLAFALALPLHVVLHELGHLAAAAALGLRPQAIRLFGRTFRISDGAAVPAHRNAVSVSPPPDVPALPARMIALALAGPAVNLATAGLVWFLVAGSPGEVLAGVAFSAAVLGAANLWPHAIGPGCISDGETVKRWLRQPGEERALVRAHARWEIARDGLQDAAAEV